MMENKTVMLRPHHGLCIRFFQGKGYSEAFTAHMTKVIATLQDDTEIKLITNADAICSACPNWNGAVCSSQEKVISYDKSVLSAIGNPDGKMTYGAFRKLLQTHVFDAGKFEEICGDCAWGALCHKKDHTL